MQRICWILMLLFAVNAGICKSHSNRSTISLIDNINDSLVNTLSNLKIRRLTVLPFSDKTNPESQQGAIIAEYLISKLNQTKRFALVDRSNFQQMLQEIDLSGSDLADPSSAIRIGKFLAADAILTGSIAEAFGAIIITVRCIRTETTEIIGTASITMSKVSYSGIGSFNNSQKQISSALFKSLLIPGWGQFSKNQPIRGCISLAAGGSAAAFLGYSCYTSAKKRKDLNDHKESLNGTRWETEGYDKYSNILKKLEKEHNDSYDRALIVGIITGAVWALNLIDASVAGIQFRNQFEAYFSSYINNNPFSGVVINVEF